MCKLSAAYGWRHGENLSFSLDATLAFVGDAPLEQTAQHVTVRGDYDSNFSRFLGGLLRYDHPQSDRLRRVTQHGWQ